MTRLVTERLVLRPLERADLGDLATLYADPSLMRHIGDGSTATPRETEIWLRRNIDDAARNGFGLMATELKAGGEFIGRCGYKEWDVDGEPMLEIGWMIATAHQGKGLATEAGIALRNHGFRELERPFLISVIQPSNTASVKVAERLGGTSWRTWVTPRGISARLYRYEKV